MQTTPPNRETPGPKLATADAGRWAHALDKRDAAWKIDMLARVLVLVGGVSALLFIAAIFLFIAREGFDFILHDLSLTDFLFGKRWEPTVEPAEYERWRARATREAGVKLFTPSGQPWK